MRCTRWKTIASIATALFFSSHGQAAVEEGLTGEEMRGLLKERDAAIIQLQHTVNDLLTRLEAVERSVNPDAPRARESPEPQSIAETSTSASTATTEPRGFAKLDVDEDAAQRALERTLIQAGALLLPTWRMQFVPSVAYSYLQSDFPSLVSNGDELLLGSADRERTVVDANLDFRVGLPFNSQLELGLPYRWVDEKISTRFQGTSFGQSVSRNGHDIGSLEVGVAKTLLRERGWRPDIVGRITWDTGSGGDFDNKPGLSSTFESVGASLTLLKRTDPLVFVGSIGYRTFSEEGGIEPGDQFGISFGTALAVSPTSSLFATIDNQFLAKTRRDNVRIDGSDIKSFSLSLGASTLLTRGILFSLTSGIGITEDAPDYSLVLSASMYSDALRRFVYRK
jgi:hypothetical protein